MTLTPVPSWFAKATGHSLLQLKKWMDRAAASSTQPFDQASMIRPRISEKFYSWTHYGIFIPQLPDPHRYLNIMTLLGTPSAAAFDDDALIHEPRHSSSLFSSTHALPQAWLKAYDMRKECQFSPNGEHLQWGNELTISGQYPDICVSGDYLDLKYELKIRVTDQVSWFVRTPVYDHFSLLAQYEGYIEYQGERLELKDLCTYEYARATGLHALSARKIPVEHKIPLDFFTYQIINLNENTQILLTKADILQQPAVYMAHIRHLDAAAEVYENVRLHIIDYWPEAHYSPMEEPTYLPKRFYWQVWDTQGNCILEIQAESDSTYHYGHGKGYASSYAFEGRYLKNTVSGRGYIEYVNLQPHPVE